MNTIIYERVCALRAWMKNRGLQAFIIPSTDPHASEYVADHWQTRQWISGFTGSAGTAVVTMDDAALWTDSRYYLQGADQLKDTPFSLMKDGQQDTPTIVQWLANILGENSVVGVDAFVNTVSDCQEWSKELQHHGIRLELSNDPAEELWKNRPLLPCSTIEIQPLQYAGESATSKLERVRKVMAEEGADAMLVTQLDEIAWLTNLRGEDVHCTPVFIAYLLITQSETLLFCNAPKHDEIKTYCAEHGIALHDYKDTLECLKTMTIGRLMIDPTTCNAAIGLTLANNPLNIIHRPTPVAAMKARKNEAEIAGFREAMIWDGVAMVRLLMWLEKAVASVTVTEMGVDAKLRELHEQCPLYRDLSFDTIAAYAEHGAIVHYEATRETDATLKPKGLLLLDCGAQYTCGTTDITRTIPLGTLSDEERRDYTLVLKGHLRLAMTKFPFGTTGTQLDALARYAMWQEGINYGHGTGHGVGSRLSVHEGPHQIRMQWRPAKLEAGMTVTNEPGIYRAGSHGIRIENTMLVTPYRTTDFGEFLQLEPLTLCPIDMRPVVADMLSDDERQYLEWYHKHVCDVLTPYLNDEERAFITSNPSFSIPSK